MSVVPTSTAEPKGSTNTGRPSRSLGINSASGKRFDKLASPRNEVAPLGATQERRRRQAEIGERVIDPGAGCVDDGRRFEL